MEHEDDGDTNCNWCIWNNSQRIGKGMEELEIRGQVETIQTTALLRLARILCRVLVTWGDLLLLKLRGKTISQR